MIDGRKDVWLSPIVTHAVKPIPWVPVRLLPPILRYNSFDPDRTFMSLRSNLYGEADRRESIFDATANRTAWNRRVRAGRGIAGGTDNEAGAGSKEAEAGVCEEEA